MMLAQRKIRVAGLVTLHQNAGMETQISDSTSDYDRMAEAISFIIAHAEQQPTLEQVAAHLQLSPFHFQRLFSRWVGVTPKRFLQVLTVERGKQLLAESKPLLAVADHLGLSSGSRLYDHFVQLEAATPGEYRLGGKGLTIEYGLHDSPFGLAFIALTGRGVCAFSFVDDGDCNVALADLQQRWPGALLMENQPRTQAVMQQMFATSAGVEIKRPLSLYVSGTNFQISVWRALLEIPPMALTTYSEIAYAMGRPGAARAVGQAVGANPVAFLIPCHRVIRQSGELGGYHWGLLRKQAIFAWEAAHYDLEESDG